MANVKKALYNVAVFLVSLFITGSINVSNIKNTQDTSRVTLTVNETETLQEMNGWGGDNVYQEGCHYDEKEMFKLYRMFAKSIKERGLNVKMSMCEVSKIGNPAFEYIKKISKDEELSNVMATYSYHSYWSDTNYLLKKAWGQYLRRYYPDVTVEMDEWCELPCHSTTRSISGARTMARTICQDIMYSNATAWTSWVAVSEWGDNSDGLIIADHECNEYYTAKRYNALAHFSKFVPVGSKVISNEKDVNDRVAWKIKNQMGFVILNKTNCASFLTPDGSIVVVIVNDDAGCTFNFEGISSRDNLKIYTTNDQYDLKLTYDGEYKQEVEIPGLSITTLIFS